jgi:protein-S-isoprenylcysteine O-methyltransferase Ste14
VLVTHGPFGLSRNPMWLSGLIVWLGWALFFGSVVILIVAIVLWVVTHVFTVPREERALEARFGETYRAYKARVPRWLGLPRR